MQRDEVRALGELAGVAAGDIAVQARQLHEGISQRVFGLVGPGAVVVRTIHDGVTGRAYTGARALTGAIVNAGARAVSVVQPPDAPPIDASPVGRVAMGALNGAFGDSLLRRKNALSLEMSLRRGGRDVPIDAPSLWAAFPDATPKLVVFLHGLCETDEAWALRSARYVPYGPRLQAEHGYTPLFIRYNSGRHISENGRDLALLLRQLMRAWPCEVAETALIGHSMGGLVARSACHYDEDRGWTDSVRHVFMLGTPHAGAPLEQAANRLGVALGKLPETRGLARPINARSAGMKDLRYGYLCDEDWFGCDPDVYLHRAAREIPFLPTANHYFVCATLSRDIDGRLARIVGDLLVLRASAWGTGRGERMRFPVDHYRHIGGATHFDLLNHPAIYELLKDWITRGRELEAETASAVAAVAGGVGLRAGGLG
jgi:pimeloyl-ACP methyl ester carboxylesterase